MMQCKNGSTGTSLETAFASYFLRKVAIGFPHISNNFFRYFFNTKLKDFNTII